MGIRGRLGSLSLFVVVAGVSTGCASNTSVPPAEEVVATDSPEAAFRRLLADMGVKLVAGQNCVEVSGWVNMQKGLVEVFACAPGGKIHEAVVVLDCVPSGLHAGLLALGLQPGTPVEIGTEDDYKPPSGDGVRIEVYWQDASGAERQVRAEDWVWNQTEQRSMERGNWVFAGSFLQPVSGAPGTETYAADYVKSLVTTYHDSTSILECPHAEGIDDTVYYANEKTVPPTGTSVTVRFFPVEPSAG